MLLHGYTMPHLSIFLLILDLQANHGWSDKSVSLLFKFMKILLREENRIPRSRAEARKILDSLGMR